MDQMSSFALLVGTVVDSAGSLAPRTPISVAMNSIGTLSAENGVIWAQANYNAGFVLAFDAQDIVVDYPSSSGPSPKHLVGAFDVSFTISAQGYADLPVTYSCNNNALPITPPPYVLQPNPIAIVGGVSGDGAPLVGANVQIVSSVPSLPMPPATTTDANGNYVFASVPAAQSLVINVSGGGFSGSQNVSLQYLDPVITVNFELY
jgi:hypothetical protein